MNGPAKVLEKGGNSGNGYYIHCGHLPKKNVWNIISGAAHLSSIGLPKKLFLMKKTGKKRVRLERRTGESSPVVMFQRDAGPEKKFTGSFEPSGKRGLAKADKSSAAALEGKPHFPKEAYFRKGSTPPKKKKKNPKKKGLTLGMSREKGNQMP